MRLTKEPLDLEEVLKPKCLWQVLPESDPKMKIPGQVTSYGRSSRRGSQGAGEEDGKRRKSYGAGYQEVL